METCTEDCYFKRTEIDNLEAFENKELDSINAILPVAHLRIGKLKSGDDTNFIFINKVKDEWFFVHKSINDTYYKCDQFDDLIAFLNSLKSL